MRKVENGIMVAHWLLKARKADAKDLWNIWKQSYGLGSIEIRSTIQNIEQQSDSIICGVIYVCHLIPNLNRADNERALSKKSS